MRLRAQVAARLTNLAEKVVDGLALERLRQFELEVHRAVVVDRYSAVAKVRISQEALGSADDSVRAAAR